MMRYRLTLLLALFTAMAAVAQSNRVYIDDFEIYPDSVATVHVVMANADATRGIQFNMTLPQGLVVAGCELSDMSRDLGMRINYNADKQRRDLTFVIFPHAAVCFESGQDTIMTLTIESSPDFRGGEISLWKVRGSTAQSKSLVMDDAAATVSVPESALVGIPIDMQQADDRLFNTKDQPF